MDERIKTLAYNLVHFSCKLEKGEKVWISCNGVHPLPLVKQIIKETYRVGAIPTKNNRIDPQYSRAAEFTIYEIEIELVKKKEVVPLGKTAIADFLTEQDINAVICGNIRSSARNILRAKRIELTYGVLGEVDDVMIRYLSGERLGDIDENAYWKAGREGE